MHKYKLQFLCLFIITKNNPTVTSAFPQFAEIWEYATAKFKSTFEKKIVFCSCKFYGYATISLILNNILFSLNISVIITTKFLCSIL
jgi:hypothetical protein